MTEIGQCDRFYKLTAGRLTAGDPDLQDPGREFMNIIETLSLTGRHGPILS